MRFFQKEAWRYAVLLILLFVIAAIAVSKTIAYLQDQVSGTDFKIVAILIWTITLGFMFIAGAFGIWAIQFAAESESRRRIGLLVDAMDYLRDGLIVVNSRGEIGGSNPAARRLAGNALEKNTTLVEAFPCISEDDSSTLINADEPTEIERDLPTDSLVRTLRFRSQPSEGLTLILLSDVTGMNTQRLRVRRAAHLQLVGQIAKGIAHDFNNLLCSISGHAAILGRARQVTPELAASASAIIQGAERGIALAGHLLELAPHPGLVGSSTYMIAEHIRNAAQALRDSLSINWQVECSIDEQLPPVAIPGAQIEQIVLNLGLLASDAVPGAGKLRISAAKPGSSRLFDVSSNYACAIVFFASADPRATEDSILKEAPGESGVILSVIRSIIEEADGTLDELTAADGKAVYRVALPHGVMPAEHADASQMATELKAYISNWSILLALAPKSHSSISAHLTELGAKVERVDNVMSVLARIEEGRGLDVAIIEKQLLGQEAKALLRAILRLRPSAGMVVLCEDARTEGQGLPADIVLAGVSSSLNTLLTAMIEAKSMALKRRTTAEVKNHLPPGQ